MADSFNHHHPENPIQTSGFQLGLIATLAMGLGFSLTSAQAIGYPAGAVVSSGSNPIRSATGPWDLTGPTDSESSVLAAPEDHDLVLTEVMVGLTQNDQGCWASGRFQLKDSSGVEIATIPIHNGHMYNAQNQPTQLKFDSGIRVPAGAVIDVEWNFVVHNCSMNSYDLSYVMSGYLSAP